MKTIRYKAGTKTMSLILSVAMTMQLGWALTETGVSAAAAMVDLSVEEAAGGDTITMGSGYGGASFTLTASGNTVTVDYEDPTGQNESQSVSTTNLGTLNPWGECSLDISADIESNLNIGGEYTIVTINSGYTLTCTELTGVGVLYVAGTLELDEFISADHSLDSTKKLIYNQGTIVADVVDIRDTQYLRYTDGITPVYKVTTSFTKGEEDFPGKVIATSGDTFISSDGGTFTLELDGTSMEIDGDIYGTAASILYEGTEVELDGVPDSVYAGTVYDFSDGITVLPEEYTGTPYLEYSPDGIRYSTDRPDYAGTFYVRAVAPTVTGFAGSTSDPVRYDVDMLPLEEVDAEGNFFTYGNVIDGVYVDEQIKIIPPAGFLVRCTHALDYEFSDYVLMGPDELLNDAGELNVDIMFDFCRTSDNAESEYLSINSISNLDFAGLVFDDDDPGIYGEMADGLELSIEDGDTVVADELSFEISDTTLDTVLVTVNGEAVVDESDYEGDTYEVELTSEVGNHMTVVVTATDKAGKEFNLTFTLRHTTVDPDEPIVTVPDTRVGEEYEVSVETESNGEISITYTDDNGDPEDYMEEKPTAAGDYTAHVYIDETEDYYESFGEASFTISKWPVSATVTVADSYVGDEYEPVITTESDGDRTIYYRRDGEDTLNNTTEKPTEAGRYHVTVMIAATGYYDETVCYTTFDISKREATASVTVSDTYTGESYDPTLSTNSDGRNDAVFEYKLSDAPDSAYTTTKPTLPGTYTVRVTIPETDRYLGTSATSNFTISLRTATASVSVIDTLVGDSYDPELTTNSDGASGAVFEYKAAGASDSSYSTTKPTAAGTYIVRAAVPETERYLEVSATSSFTISLRTPTASVSLDDPYAGTAYDPVITTDSDGKSRTVFEYKPVSAPDSEYSTTKPVDTGSYIVRATVPETSTYHQAVCTVEFKITFLTAPGSAYEMTGTSGENDFFISDVDLKAPSGYQISSSFKGTYSDSIPYSEDLNTVYLMRTSDGALTSAIAITSRPQIDKEEPTITDTTGTLSTGSIVYQNNIVIKASDDNLASLTVNGEVIDLATAGNILTLSPGNGFMRFKIIAVDKAGHISTVEFTLMAEWLRDRIIPADLLLPLQAGEGYTLGEGSWTVTGEQGEDSTVYNGGVPVYVSNDGDFTFTLAN